MCVVHIFFLLTRFFALLEGRLRSYPESNMEVQNFLLDIPIFLRGKWKYLVSTSLETAAVAFLACKGILAEMIFATHSEILPFFAKQEFYLIGRRQGNAIFSKEQNLLVKYFTFVLEISFQETKRILKNTQKPQK